ncbi:MAG: hypothetical protein E7456_05275 [Ruminococcaceae bacterium]|nr:hypothetical protein [Oscillospiraceae bacterium]
MPKFIPGVLGILFRIIVIVIDKYYCSVDSGFNLFSNIIFFIGLLFFWNSLMEMSDTYHNRKLMFLKRVDINEIESKPVDRSKIVSMSMLKQYSHIYYVIKNEYTVHKIGAEVIWLVDHDTNGHYYYIDEIKDGQIDRIKYRDFEHFMDVLDQINGHRDTFDVVSVDKIVVPKKKKKL